MTIVERTLAGPGPSNPYPEATEALAGPLLGHLDPAFLEILDQTCGRLRSVFGTANPRTLPLSGTGSAGMEAAFCNTAGPGDVVVVAVNGLFGERMVDVAGRCGAEVVPVRFPWGEPVEVEQVLSAHPDPKVVAVVQAETSTGVRSDVGALARALHARGDALVLADCVTSIGGIPVDIDASEIDLAYAGTQKCLGVAPGLAPFTIGERAWERRIQHPQSWYLDLGMIGDYATPDAGSGGGSGGRTYHHTAPVAMVASLNAGLGRILEEGLPAVYARHEEHGRALQDGLEAMGLELFAAPGSRLPELTTVRVPDGVDSARVRRTLLERYSLEIGAGAGEYAASVWRIGLMGPNACAAVVTLILGALRETLGL